MALGAVGMAGMIGATVSTTVVGYLVQDLNFGFGFGLLCIVALAGLGLLWWKVPETRHVALQDD
jgi:MFS family permease